MDHVVVGDEPDYYAAISFANVPDGRRIMMAWMNDWRYANALPRELTLQLVDGACELEQVPVRELASLEVKSDRLRRTNVTVADTATVLPWSSDAYKFEVTVDPQDATFRCPGDGTRCDLRPVQGWSDGDRDKSGGREAERSA